ncbi:MAG: NAD(P)H-binding protein [Bryobacteraceae bacterium]|nr:NAD(P)H-binding protein [Bryobacteraceae bacterium]
MTALLVVGATGLVGRAALEQALEHGAVSRVVAVTRRPLEPHPKLENPVVDFEALREKAPWWRVDGVVYALGTTRRRAGSKEAFRRVDFDYTAAVARLARRHGARAFALTSSTGADPRSRMFYLRTKGEVEQELMRCGFPSLTLVRPAGLGGGRAEERRWESLGLRALEALGPLLPRRYRVVPAASVARALIEAAVAARPGIHIVESEDIPRTRENDRRGPAAH